MPVNQPLLGSASHVEPERVESFGTISADRYQSTGSSNTYVKFDNNGNVYINSPSGTLVDTLYGTWLLLGSAGDYEIKAQPVSQEGGGTATGTYNSWLSLSSDRQWGVPASALNSPVFKVISIRIRDATTLEEVISPITVQLSGTVG